MAQGGQAGSPSIAERLVPGGLRRTLEKRRTEEAVERLVLNNVENVRWAVLQNLNDGIMRFTGELDRCLALAAEDIERALDESARRRRTSEASVAYRLEILDGCRRDLGLLSSRLEDEDAPVSE